MARLNLSLFRGQERERGPSQSQACSLRWGLSFTTSIGRVRCESTVFLHLSNEKVQGRGWINHPSLKNTLIVWKASVILRSEPLPSHSVLNGFFFFSSLFWWVALPSTAALGFAEVPAQWLFHLPLHIVLRLKRTTHNDAKKVKVNRKSEESVLSPLALVASTGKN